MKLLVPGLVSCVLLLLSAESMGADRAKVLRSYAACRDRSIVERFEEFERRDDDQGYKQLYLSTGTNRTCIFLRAGELLYLGESNGRWTCVKEDPGSQCYWTASDALSR